MASKIETRRSNCHALLSSDRRRSTFGNGSIRQFLFCIFPVLPNKAHAAIWVLVALVGVKTTLLHGQALPAGENRMSIGVFGTGSVANTQLPYYADNALGFNVGAFVQATPWLGVEVRGGAYPMKGTFQQAPITAGVVAAQRRSRLVQALPFIYFGGGFSRAQYSKANYQPSVPLWTPCWQATGGTDLAFGKFTWRMYEVNWTETYTLRKNIRTVGLSTGLVYFFKR